MPKDMRTVKAIKMTCHPRQDLRLSPPAVFGTQPILYPRLHSLSSPRQQFSGIFRTLPESAPGTKIPSRRSDLRADFSLGKAKPRRNTLCISRGFNAGRREICR